MALVLKIVSPLLYQSVEIPANDAGVDGILVYA
jgi:hypothetical protein